MKKIENTKLNSILESCKKFCNGKADIIYIYCSNENKVQYCDFFIEINNKIFKKNKILENLDRTSSINKQREIGKTISSFFSEYIASEIKIPTEIKITYNCKTNKIDIKTKNKDVYTQKNISVGDVFDEWFAQLSK